MLTASVPISNHAHHGRDPGPAQLHGDSGARPGQVCRAPPDRNVFAKRKAFRGMGTRFDKTVVRVSARIDRGAGVIAAR